ncbi:TPM domain-containing protein [Sphingomonas astaxanthinifaciens]|uniref:TPM domain-containing protein n=1 Tax=Sphingomonas astaxanthinifaciens DSM 22298 TaxID=1123267 RepID=A0ABQ5Z9F1_9SPHN|nr:TPM domain-containing protein [Sphingomonas astaxanthinifaciens]GLR47409.1 hypothetical protein GCM10007925_11200 [Sphingomonas astaxanthinifaciens DSM 22298]
MRALVLVALAAGLLACGKGPAGETLREADPTGAQAAPRVVKVQAKGRVIDTAQVLSPAEEQAIAARIAGGRSIFVVTLVPAGGDSMERIGWAVSNSSAANRPLLLLVDPRQAAVRIEGELAPEKKAAVASAMQADLKAGKAAAAIGRGLDVLGQDIGQ